MKNSKHCVSNEYTFTPPLYYLSVIFIFALSMFISTSGGLAQDFLQPCDNGDSTSWGGLKQHTYCFYELSSPSGCDSCCYTIYFYERWTGPDISDFEISIVKIVLNSGDSCDNCLVSNIIFNSIYDYVEEIADTSFILRILNGDDPGSDTPVRIFSSAECLNAYGERCDNENRCCLRIHNMMFGNPDDLFEITGWNWYSGIDTIGGSCINTSCYIKCEAYEVLHQDSIPPPDCDSTCDTTTWQQHVSSAVNIDTLGCSNCSIIIYYSRRDTKDCVPNYHDFRLDSIVSVGCDTNLCDPGKPDASEVYQYALSWVLNHGGPPMGPDSCATNWRVFHYSCWEMRSKVVLNPCPGNVCCMAKYRVCTDGFGRIKEFTRIDYYPPRVLECIYASYACVFMCFINPYPM